VQHIRRIATARREHTMQLGTLAIALGIAGAIAASAATAQTFTKPVRIITSTAGSVGDIYSRQVSARLSERLGQPVIVDNRSVAGGGRPMMIAGAQMPPDGHGYVIIPGPSYTLLPLTVKDPGFDAAKDFTPVGMLGSMIFGFAVSIKEPVASIEEFVALARSRPGQLNYGGFGANSPQSMAMHSFARNRGLSLVGVPYNGSTPAMLDLTSGRVSAMVSALSAVLPLAQSGKLRILAVAGDRRLAILPDVPSTRELGITEIENLWIGVLAPAKTPPDFIARVNREINAIMALPEVQETLAKAALSVATNSPAEFAAYIRKDMEFWRKLADAAGVVPE